MGRGEKIRAPIDAIDTVIGLAEARRDRGVYVGAGVDGYIEVDVVDSAGKLAKRVTVAESRWSQRELDDLHNWLNREDVMPPPSHGVSPQRTARPASSAA